MGTGASLLILSQLMWAVATVIGKKLLVNAPPLLFTAIVLPLAGLMFLPVLLFFDFRRDIKPLLLNNFWLITIYTIFWLVLGEFIFNAGLSRLSPTVATLLTFTLPVFTAAIAIVFLGEHLSWRVILGSALIFAGVLTLSQ